MNTSRIRTILLHLAPNRIFDARQGVDHLADAMNALLDELDKEQKAWEEVAERAALPSRLPSANSVIGAPIDPSTPAEYREAVRQFMAACDAAGEVARVEEAPQYASHYWRLAAEKWRQVAEKAHVADAADLDAARAAFSSACSLLGEPDDGVPEEHLEDPRWFWRAATHHWIRVVDEGPTAKKLERMRHLLGGGI